MKRALLTLLLVAGAALGQDRMDSTPCRMDGTDCTVVPTYATMTAPSGCVATSVPVFLGSPVALGCDDGLKYDAVTDTLTVGGTVYANLLELGGSFRWQAFRYDGVRLNADGDIRWGNTFGGGWFSGMDSGLRRVSPGLVGVTSGGSNLGSLQAGNLTAVALATPTITSPLTVNGTPGATTYGYKAVAFLNDGTSSAASAEVTIATGPAALDGTDNITVAWPAVANQAYSNLYRTTGGAAPPKLIYSGTAPTFIDTGTEISAETPATKNTTGYAAAARAKITGLATYADNAAALTGGLVAGDLYRTSTGVLMVTY